MTPLYNERFVIKHEGAGNVIGRRFTFKPARVWRDTPRVAVLSPLRPALPACLPALAACRPALAPVFLALPPAFLARLPAFFPALRTPPPLFPFPPPPIAVLLEQVINELEPNNEVKS